MWRFAIFTGSIAEPATTAPSRGVWPAAVYSSSNRFMTPAPLHLGVVLVERPEAGMVGLARLGIRGIAQLDAPRIEHARSVGRTGDQDDRRPSGLGAKADRDAGAGALAHTPNGPLFPTSSAPAVANTDSCTEACCVSAWMSRSRRWSGESL